MATPAGFETTFGTLRALLKPYARHFVTIADEPGRYYLAAKVSKTKSGAAIWFGGVEIRKNHVSFHLIPVYAEPALVKALSPALRRRMQGKSCFNFTAIDPAHVAELEALTKKGFDGFTTMYQSVGASDALDAFRAAAPVRRLHHDGVDWQYRVAAGGPQGLLLLPGAVGDGDAYFTLAPLLAPTHTLIACAYPRVDSLTRLLDGIRYILDREGVGPTDIVGGSFGGLVAQAFLRRFPQRARRVVLSAAGPAKTSRAASNEKWARVMGALPIGVSRALLRTIVRASLRPVTDDRAFWRAFYFEAIAAVSRDDLVARYALSADIDRHGPPSPAGLQEWSGAVLILEGGADRIAHADARDSLKSLYPGARVHTFPGAGHAMAAERRNEWAAEIATFLTAVSDTVVK